MTKSADAVRIATKIGVPVELVQEQEKLEQESLTAGVQRYRKLREAQGETATQPGMMLLKKAIGDMAEAVEKYVGDVMESGRPARGAAVVAKFLSQFDADVVAYITARYVLNAMVKRSKLQTVALAVSKALEDAINHDELKEKNPGLYRQLQRKIEKSSDERYRHVLLKRQQKYAGLATIEWSLKNKLQIGELLVHLMASATGLVKIENTMEGRQSALMVQPTEETMKWLDEAHARCELFNPVFMPMVVKPRPWKGPFGGGYLGKHLRYALVKTGNKNYLEELKSWEMPKVYATVNALQNTAWQINPLVLDVMRQVWDGGGNLGGLPPADVLSLPAKDFPEDAESDDPRVVAWRKRAAEVYSENARLVSKRVAMTAKIGLAEKFAAYDELFFPHALDWRGRAYPVVPVLNPQADDSAKALLQFAHGAPLGENGAYWLAVHGANCFGVDKVSFEERVAWVNENADRIIECAENPLDGSRWWAEADAPYQFLAFCFEWAGVVERFKADGHTWDYVSHLPVGLDGSCNGLQNFSAMLRDEVGGKATNLVPSEKPSDIYAEVAKVANEIADNDGGNLDDYQSDDERSWKCAKGNKWAGRINRKLVKRNTMTVPYAVTEFGMRDQLYGELRKLKEEGALDVDFTFEDAKYLAAVNYAAIGQVVVAARNAMDWLKEVAKVAAKDGLPIKWVAPSGMLVVQDYREAVGQRFESYISGRRVQLTLKVETTKIDKRRMASGISPNFVHSLDAAHMVSTVQRCLDAGLQSFAMVHDSFGTHAGNIDVLAQELRAAFVEQYSGDVLGGFREQVIEQLPPELAEKVPATPPFGKLDVSAVMASEYFFA